MKECPKCHTMIEDDAVFCGVCGTKQENKEVETQAEEQSSQEEQFCVHCGKSIEVGSAYCPYCGKPQDIKETKNEEPQPKQEKPKVKEEPKVEESPKEDSKDKEPQREVSQPEKEPTYEYEEEKKSKTWLWFLLALLIAGGAGWYYFMNDSSTEAVGENVEAPDSIMTSPVVDKNAPTSALAFLDQFYKNEIEKDDLRNYVTANVINKLRSDYDYDCPSNDCLATWVFTAYPAGADLDLEKGPIITKTDTEGKFKVDFRYSGYNGNEKTYETRTVYLTVTEMEGKYMICDYEVADGETIEEKEGLLSFEDALRIAEEMQIKDGVVEGFRSPENVNKIMKAYGYEPKGKYFVDRQLLFGLLYYKNCTLAESTGNDCYTDFPSANGGGDASFVGLDDTKGATLVENDESTIVYKYSSIQITGYKRGVFSLNYCIFVSKEE